MGKDERLKIDYIDSIVPVKSITEAIKIKYGFHCPAINRYKLVVDEIPTFNSKGELTSRKGFYWLNELYKFWSHNSDKHETIYVKS